MADGPAYLTAGGHRLEYLRFGPPPEAALTLVFLHEGLGSAALWRDFPAALADATGCGALVYSRAGYGGSDPVELPRPLTYMHVEGLEVLPEVIAAAGLREHLLVGHSDGASIALIHAGGAPSPGLRGLILEAPHVFTEDVSVRSIAAAAEAYRTGDLRARLEVWHGSNVDCAFWGWNRAWLDPGFLDWNIESYLPAIRVPVLVIQGEDDQYGTIAQVDRIARAGAQKLLLDRCGHAPHRDRREVVLAAMRDFVLSVLAARS